MVLKRFEQLKELNEKYQVGYLAIYEVLRDSENDEEVNAKLENIKGKEYDKSLDKKIEKIIESSNSFFDFSIAKEVIVDFPKSIIYNKEKYYLVGLAQDKYDLYYLGVEINSEKILFCTCVGGWGPYSDVKLKEKEKEKINKIIDNYFANNSYEKLIYNSLTGEVF